MNQPLRNRSDYGTTGDMAERLKKFQDDEIDAAMYKEVLLPNPRPIAPEQERARSRSSVLANVDSKFKKIRSMLKGRGETTLSGVETKTILNALDKIYKEYRELEDR